VVTLDGSGSHDPNADLLRYTWTQREGPEVTLSDRHTVSPAFLATEVGEYLFELIVNDGRVDSLPDQVSVVIRNVPPAANAGEDQEGYTGTRVVLDGGRSSDPNGDDLRFSWTQSSGEPVTLSGASSASASFVPEQPGVYVFHLVTSDDQFSSLPDEVQVIVNTETNHVPTADAGEDQTVKAGDPVTLDGSGSSDPEGSPLSYQWSQVEGPEMVILEDASAAQAQFDATAAGLYRFQLIVNDGELASVPDSTIINVESAGNRAPTASIMVTDPFRVGDWVSLDGSGSSDADRDLLAYSWSQTGGPQVLLEFGDRTTAGFYAVNEGTLAFELVVHDGESQSIPASVDVQVLAALDRTLHPSDAGGGGCSVGLRTAERSEVGPTDIGYVVTLFLPALAATWYQKRRYRRRKGRTA
jgi:hypothetical protein